MPHKKGTHLDGIRTLEDLMSKCYVDPDTGCWHCRTHKDKSGSPQVRFVTPDTHKETKSRGRRAALYLATGAPVPQHLVAFAKSGCHSLDCVNPEHTRSGTKVQWGKAMAYRGVLKGRPAKIAANQIISGRKRIFTPEQVREIRRSDESDAILALRHGSSRYAIWSVRKGRSYRNVPGGPNSIFNLGG
jgi:hypothetical protein